MLFPNISYTVPHINRSVSPNIPIYSIVVPSLFTCVHHINHSFPMFSP